MSLASRIRDHLHVDPGASTTEVARALGEVKNRRANRSLHQMLKDGLVVGGAGGWYLAGSDDWSIQELAALAAWLDLCEVCGQEIVPKRSGRAKQRFCSPECKKLRGVKVCSKCGAEFYGARKPYDNNYCSTDCYRARQRRRGRWNHGTFQKGCEGTRERSDISFQCALPGCDNYFSLKLWEYRQRKKQGCDRFFCCRDHFFEFQRRYRRKNHVKGGCKSGSIYKSRKARGVCPGCQGKPVDGKVHCYSCAEKHRDYQRRRRKR